MYAGGGDDDETRKPPATGEKTEQEEETKQQQQQQQQQQDENPPSAIEGSTEISRLASLGGERVSAVQQNQLLELLQLAKEAQNYTTSPSANAAAALLGGSLPGAHQPQLYSATATADNATGNSALMSAIGNLLAVLHLQQTNMAAPWWYGGQQSVLASQPNPVLEHLVRQQLLLEALNNRSNLGLESLMSSGQQQPSLANTLGEAVLAQLLQPALGEGLGPAISQQAPPPHSQENDTRFSTQARNLSSTKSAPSPEQQGIAEMEEGLQRGPQEKAGDLKSGDAGNPDAGTSHSSSPLSSLQQAVTASTMPFQMTPSTMSHLTTLEAILSSRERLGASSQDTALTTAIATLLRQSGDVSNRHQATQQSPISLHTGDREAALLVDNRTQSLKRKHQKEDQRLLSPNVKPRKMKTKRVPQLPQNPVQLTHRPPIDLGVASDEGILSPYQCFLRKQIELFETTPEQVGGKAQGRNTPIVAGQVGIQCKHCSKIPMLQRISGSVFYSQTLGGLYQIAQNMSKTHFLARCPNIPEDVKNNLSKLQKNLNRGSGGKEYWREAAKKLGIYEDDHILKYTRKIPESSDNLESKDEKASQEQEDDFSSDKKSDRS